MTIFLPYLIYGVFTDSNGAVVSGGTVVAKNVTTANTISTVTNALGQYVFDCANFELGWYNGDYIQLFGYSGTATDMDIYYSVDAGITWLQMNNGTTITSTANTARRKIDPTNFPGGRTADITLIA